MKNIFYILLGILLLPIAACSPLTKTQQTELQSKVKQAVEVKHWCIDATYANPLKMQPRSLGSGYDFCIRADSAFAYLPYFGEAYSVPYGDTEGGIKFKELMRDYKVSGDEKKGYEISFGIKSPRDSYQIIVNLSVSGYATINVIPTQSNAIVYNGEVIVK